MKKEELQKVHKKIQTQMTKYADKIIVGQYTGETKVKREDGDTWVDADGKHWTMKGKIAVAESKTQDAKTPWFCPQCSKTLQSKLDLKFWRIRGKCHDCVTIDEDDIRRAGKWRDYEDEKVLSNQISYLKESIIELMYYIDSLKNLEFGIHDEEKGNLLMIEKWTVPVDQLKVDLLDELANLNNALKEVEEEYESRFGNAGDEEDGQDRKI
ncbi:MAG: hypothetical protein VW683_00435 [Betaproteobacteria bacterium]|jgi:hypothetical protein